MSVHESLMGRPGQMKAQAYEQLARHYTSLGWTADTSSSSVVYFEPPTDATSEQINAAERGAAAILASYGLGVH